MALRTTRFLRLTDASKAETSRFCGRLRRVRGKEKHPGLMRSNGKRSGCQVTLTPKGGGVIHKIDEKFGVNPEFRGLSVDNPHRGIEGPATPSLSLSYNCGGGNGGHSGSDGEFLHQTSPRRRIKESLTLSIVMTAATMSLYSQVPRTQCLV